MCTISVCPFCRPAELKELQADEEHRDEERKKLKQQFETERVLKVEAVNKLAEIMYKRGRRYCLVLSTLCLFVFFPPNSVWLLVWQMPLPKLSIYFV